MGFKLRLLSGWTPKWFQKRCLDELTFSTVHGLQELILNETSEFEKHHLTTSELSQLKTSKIILNGNLKEKREYMAETHNKLVEIMIKTMGREKAIALGREAMFSAGLSLGQKFKKMLGVEDSFKKVILAAKILYNVLGIEFTVIESEEERLIMVVHRCFLSEYYTHDTCLVLSAADEGVVHGLNPRINMKFTERITEGAPCCLASINMEGID
ncbi:L-2-amino-thiazoline-4-carboxylic acid hydrolase [Methanobacterium petrolearium]|uniref:L-2-amino-thiazoline-4-carboxylic acid hydrolase n=1 Tax=Methanobacterium petrolearium TaxID=710190 RepID=UPI001AE3980B|nr:L-2-amino-thiazoline-4-carboxylic acid hydrolase [Methanobacterium petrolearium]MBP1946816.1 hypothetical protein [Methanobacterium petrolearium]BDZ69793.1 hypothetical protein GCM10025861_03100 [Methanobacterium petrolearium]